MKASVSSALGALVLIVLADLHDGAYLGPLSSPGARAHCHSAGGICGRRGSRTCAPRSSVLASYRRARAKGSGKRPADKSGAQSAARWFTQRLSHAGSAEEILAVFESDGADFNDINLCTTWNQLGKAHISKREREHFFRTHDKPLRQLQRRTERIIPRLAPRNLVGVAYGIAQLGFRPGQSTMQLIAAEAAPRLDDFNPQSPAYTAWPFATTGVRADSLFDRAAGGATS